MVALQLAPTNRHVLRSASRLFLHLDDSERAYDIIAQSDATVDDPWLIAAELSFADRQCENQSISSKGVVLLRVLVLYRVKLLS